MKNHAIAAFFAASVSMPAVADDCTSGGTPIADGALDNQIVCGSAANGDTWQEHHAQRSGGTGVVTEFALGPGHPVDPSQVVASWSQAGNTVTYDYGNGNIFSFDVFSTGANAVTFCQDVGTGTVATAALIASASPAGCP